MALNKGEWAELFIGLLSLDKRDIDLYNSKLKVSVSGISYTDKKFVSKDILKKVDLEKLIKSIKSKKGVFSLPQQILDEVGFRKANSTTKVDIFLDYIINQQKRQDGFGIKSSMSGRPSLLNASQHTNFRYLVKNLKEANSTKKAKTLIASLDPQQIEFVKCNSETFAHNLKLIDSSMDQILARINLAYFQKKGRTISEIISAISKDKSEEAHFKKRVKDFLYYTCVGMIPKLKWDGKEQIVGTLVYSHEQELFCLHRIEIDNFKDYLYDISFLDTGSTTRHKFGYLIKENGKVYVDLNLLIRMN